MFAVYSQESNFDDPLSGLRVGEQPDLEVPDGWVKVHIRAAGVNWHDLWTLRGLGMLPITPPVVLGTEGAGVLDDGTEVLLYPIMNGPQWQGDETLDPARHVPSEIIPGTFADYVVVPRRNVLVRPPELSLEAAAVLGTAWLTAYRMLATKSRLKPGQTMLVQGASGGVSTALIQLGHAAGMQVWVAGRGEKKRALAELLGAHRAFESGETLPDQVDAVFDTVGEATWQHSMQSVRPGGTIVVCGAATGSRPITELRRLYRDQVTLTGSYLGTRQEMHDMIQMLATCGVTPQIDRSLPMEDADVALRALWEGDTAGKFVLSR